MAMTRVGDEGEVEVDTSRVDVAETTKRRTILARPRFAGVVGALLFLWASFWPTLMPRTFVTQGAMSGVCAAAGYAVFVLLGWLVGLALRPGRASTSARPPDASPGSWSACWRRSSS